MLFLQKLGMMETGTSERFWCSKTVERFTSFGFERWTRRRVRWKVWNFAEGLVWNIKIVLDEMSDHVERCICKSPSEFCKEVVRFLNDVVGKSRGGMMMLFLQKLGVVETGTPEKFWCSKTVRFRGSFHRFWSWAMNSKTRLVERLGISRTFRGTLREVVRVIPSRYRDSTTARRRRK